MQADPGNVNQVLDQVTQKMKNVAAQGAGTGGATPPPLPGTGGAGAPPAIPSAVSASWSKLTGMVGTTGAALTVVGVMATAAIAAIKAVGAAIEPFVRLNSEIENTQLKFKVLLGDAAKAKAAFAETKKYADTTPFTLKETASARTKLFSANIEDMDTLKAAGDLAAASGRSLDEAAMAFARLKSGATGEAMEMLRYMNVSRQMFRAEGIDFDAGGQALATAEELTGALRNIVKANFGGMTDEIGKQWSGLWSTFGDTVDNAMRGISSGSFVWLKNAVSSAITAINGLLDSGALQQFGSAAGAIFGAIVGVVKNIGTALAPLGAIIGVTLVQALGVAAGIIATIAVGIRLIASAAEFVVDVVTSGNLTKSLADAKARQREILGDYRVQMQQAGSAVKGQTLDLNDNTEATNKNAKAMTKAQITAIEARDQAVANIKRVQAAQESTWAVEKARGRDAVQLAQMEMEQAKLNLAAMQEKEEAVRAAQEAAGKPYRKSNEMMSSEVAYAKSLENYYDKLIAKKSAMGEFITTTSKLLAEADAIDKRGGDSGVKRYEALKSSVDEYLDSLQKLRESQIQTSTGLAKMQEATSAAQAGNVTQYQNMAAVIDQSEKVFQIQALQERLQQIQQLSEAQNLGARDRFSLYEQERQVFGQLTGSISGAIDDTMQKIESMQSKALGAASSAVGILDKVGASKGAYSEVADMVSRLSKTDMSLANLGQLANVADQLKKKGISVGDIMPSSDQIISALKRELSDVPDTISKLQSGMQTLIGMSTQIGAQAAENFWKPWEAKIATLKSQFASLSDTNLNPLNYVPPPVPIPQSNAANTAAAGKNVNVNVQTTNQIQGSTLKDINDVVSKAKDRFGEELHSALVEANAQYGF